MKPIIALFTSVVLLTSCGHSSENNLVRITGTVKTANTNEVRFEYIVDNPITGDGETYKTPVDSLGHFSIEIPVQQMAEGRISASHYYHYICMCPGDKYDITIEDDTILFTGEGAEKNNFMYESEVKGTWDKAYYADFNRGKLTPEEFLITIDDFKQKRLNLLDNYENKKMLTPEFVNYYKINTQVIYEYQLKNYPRRYAYISRIPQDSLSIPDEYNKTKTFSSVVDDRKVISSKYMDLIQDILYDKARNIKRELSTHDFDGVFYSLLLDSLQGKTKEYVLASTICLYLEDRYDSLLIDKFNQLDKDQLSSSTVQKNIDKFNEKQALIGQPLCPEFSETLLVDTSETQLTFGEMMDQYKGKIVYLDIWSLNCGPCRAVMPHSQTMHKHLEGVPIEFVYISQDAPRNGVWNDIYNVTGTKTNQYRMVSYKWGTSKMLKFMGINWVPCYMIFDKEGHLINYSAERPYYQADSKNVVCGIEKTLRDLAEK